jgi:chromosome segregation ATPase
LEELKGDIDSKMQALSVDELCLRTTLRSYAGNERRTPTARTSTASRATGTHCATEESNRNELKRQQDTRNHDQSSKRREEAAIDLRGENQLLVQRCQKAVKDAKAMTEKRLQARVNEVKTMRQRLELELRETLKKMDHTQATISETQSQIKSIQDPIQLCSTHTSWRKQRASREQIMDQVETQLHHQKQNLMRATEDLRGHRQNEKSILTQLGEQVERLKEDLKDKTSALTIDSSCLELGNEALSRATPPRSPIKSPAKPIISSPLRSGQATPLSSRGGSKLGMVDTDQLPNIRPPSLTAR